MLKFYPIGLNYWTEGLSCQPAVKWQFKTHKNSNILNYTAGLVFGLDSACTAWINTNQNRAAFCTKLEAAHTSLASALDVPPGVNDNLLLFRKVVRPQDHGHETEPNTS